MGPGWVGDAGWHQVPELLKDYLNWGMLSHSWPMNGQWTQGETPRQYVTTTAAHGKHSFCDWHETDINEVTYVNVFSVEWAGITISNPRSSPRGQHLLGLGNQGSGKRNGLHKLQNQPGLPGIPCSRGQLIGSTRPPQPQDYL